MANGPGQLIYLGAALREAQRLHPRPARSRLIMTDRYLPPSGRPVMEQIAAASWDWESVAWFDQVADSFPRVGTDSLPVQRRKRPAGFDDFPVDELWCCAPFAGEEMAVALAFPSAKLVHCDEGTASYTAVRWLPPWLASRSKLVRRLRFGLRRSRAAFVETGGRCPLAWPLRRFHRRYLLFPELLRARGDRPRRDEAVVEPPRLQEAIRAVQEGIRHLLPELPLTGKRRWLVLGQYFHVSPGITWEQEFEVYHDICAGISAAGGEPLWKEHPKNAKPFGPALAKACPELLDLDRLIPVAWPIELYANRLGIEGCAGVSSTALLTLPKLHGIRARSFASRLLPCLQGQDLRVAELLNVVMSSDSFSSSPASSVPAEDLPISSAFERPTR